MEQKIKITSEETARVLDNCEDRNDLNQFGVTINWCGYEVSVKRFVSLADTMHFVDGVVSGCFAEADGDYMPEVRDFFFRCSLVEFYTNVSLPENVEEKNAIVYGTDIVDLVMQNIDKGQLRAIMDSIEKKVNYLVNTNIKKLEDEVSGVVEKVVPMFGQLQEIISDVNGDELSRFIHVVSAMSADDKMRIVQAIDEASKQEKKQILKVVE